jgi:hypothetical protein
MFDDYTGIPRAWGLASDEATAERIARAQLQAYCSKPFQGPPLADPENFTKRVVDFPSDPPDPPEEKS